MYVSCQHETLFITKSGLIYNQHLSTYTAYSTYQENIGVN